MKTKLPLLFLSLFIFAVALPAFAKEYVIDNAGLLDPTEKAELMKMASALSAAYNFDLVIVTEKDIGGAVPRDYADDFFDNNGYGIGDNRDGCLFLQVTGSRDYWFSTSGRGIQILNPAAYGKLELDIKQNLGKENPYGAYRAFLQDWEDFLTLEAQGRRFNFFYRYNAFLIVVSWIIALAAGFIIVQSWKRKMDTAHLKTQAASYIVPGSLTFREKRDRFLYSTVTKKERPRQTASGGSSVHTSSSGRSHSGGGGKY